MVLQTAGFAAATYQIDPSVIERALALSRTEPKLVLNDRRYYRIADISNAVAMIRDSQSVN